MCRDAINRVRSRRYSPTRTRFIASLQITRQDGEPNIRAVCPISKEPGVNVNELTLVLCFYARAHSAPNMV